jgi:hypothetical protein
MYSVFVVERVYCINYDVGSTIEAVCESLEAAHQWIKSTKARKLERTGEAWNDDHYYDGRLVIHEHYLHVNGERP